MLLNCSHWAFKSFDGGNEVMVTSAGLCLIYFSFLKWHNTVSSLLILNTWMFLGSLSYSMHDLITLSHKITGRLALLIVQQLVQQSALTASCSGSLWPFFMIRVKWLHRETILNDSCGADKSIAEELQTEPGTAYVSVNIKLCSRRCVYLPPASGVLSSKVL